MYFPDLETKTDCPIIIIGFFASLMIFETACLSSIISFIISVLPSKVKVIIAALIALLIYFPLARLAFILEKLGVNVQGIPLSYYRNRHYYFMRTDALDRFGTRLEKRFSKQDITAMLIKAGFKEIQFSNNRPFWVCLARKK